jgi:lipopolysaccharide/colanic/teichoic acid biosynthesis glycosyltransferase|tara:strand:+ start:10074 stop:10340 length:267 start_codon:yes stop_codon:yes gene_type:complete
MEYLQHYDENQARRHQVRPGLTGWAQINGRNTLSWDDKFALDTWYVDHQSMALDVQILWKTIFKVLQREGIHSDGEATMSKFEGSARE